MEQTFKDIKKPERARAIDFVTQWADYQLTDFRDPVRQRVKKGDPIGFSREKKRAALLMALFPKALNLKGIAKICGTSMEVVRTWRNLPNFQKAIDEGLDLLGQTISNSIENILTGSNKKPSISVRIKFDTRLETALFVVDLLPFLDEIVGEPLLMLATEKIKTGSSEWSEVIIRHYEAKHFYRSKSLHDWELRPINLELKELAIHSAIDRLNDLTLSEQKRKDWTNMLKEGVTGLFRLLKNEE